MLEEGKLGRTLLSRSQHSKLRQGACLGLSYPLPVTVLSLAPLGKRMHHLEARVPGFQGRLTHWFYES